MKHLINTPSFNMAPVKDKIAENVKQSGFKDRIVVGQSGRELVKMIDASQGTKTPVRLAHVGILKRKTS